MSFQKGDNDFNEYQGTVLKLIESTVVNLNVDYHVTEFYGDVDRPCTVNVRDTLLSVTFPQNSNLKVIQKYAFFKCSKITTIDLSPCKELTNINDYSFSSCSKLSSITFPTEKLESLGEFCFSQTPLVNVFIPPHVSSIGFSVFRDCSKLQTFVIDIESRIVTLHKYMIVGSLVTSFVIPKNVRTLDQGTFEGAKSLLEIKIAEGNNNFVLNNKAIMDAKMERILCFPLGTTGDYSIPAGTKYISSAAFITSILTSVTFPEGLLEIESWTFTSSYSLKEIIIPDSVTKIGSYAFYDCTGITKVKLSSKCETIESFAFTFCSFSSIVIPEGVKHIGDECFIGNPNLVQITLPSTLETIGGKVFPEKDDLNITFGNNSNLKITKSLIIMDIPETFIAQYMGSHKDFAPEIPKTIKTINRAAFANKQNLVGIKFPADSELTTIGESAFVSCINLKDIEFPASLFEIKTLAFSKCNSLQNLVFKSSLTYLRLSCFENCANLKTVNLQATNVTIIDEKAFFTCTNLETVLLPPNVLSFLKSCFSYCSSLSTVDIPENADIVNIEDECFRKTAIQSFNFPSSSAVLAIKRYAFCDCHSLSSVRFCKSINDIGFCAFSGTALTEINLTESINKLSPECFSNCPLLTSLHIPANSSLEIERLGGGIFKNSTSFATITCDSDKFKVYIGALFSPDLDKILIFPPASPVTCLPIPQSVHEICNGAFMHCINLRSIIISKKSVVKIGNNAFEGCKKLHYINIPSEVVNIGNSAFKGCNSLICGVDVENTDKDNINKLINEGKLPRNALRDCAQLTCKVSNFAYSRITLFMSLSAAFMLF